MKFHVSQLGLFDVSRKKGPLLSETLTPKDARYTMSNHERRFLKDAKQWWPTVSWRRYAPISILVHKDLGPSVWYAPFYCVKAKLVIVLDTRDAFPYTVSGRNAALYAEHGYTVLYFSEDLAVDSDPSGWTALLTLVGARL